MSAPLTDAQLRAIHHDADLRALLVGDRFENLRAVAEATKQALDDRERLIAEVRKLLAEPPDSMYPRVMLRGKLLEITGSST